MTTYTITELAREALSAPGLLALEQDPSAAELADAITVCSSEILQMNVRDIPIWNGSEIEIPQEYFTILGQRCALPLMARNGGLSLVDAVLAMEALENKLRQMAMVPATGAPMQSEYF